MNLDRNKKILIVVPSFKILGGVANHYSGLSPHWKYKIKYCFQGKRPHIPAILTLIPDFIIFVFTIIFWRPDVVILNPSLRNYQIKRDSIYLQIANWFSIDVITFVHGWDQSYYLKLKDNNSFFINTFGKSKFIYVLYSAFKSQLEDLNIPCPILLTSTKVADNLIKDFDINSRNGSIKQILFLARIEKSKGIFIAIDAFKTLKSKYDLSLSVCGNGEALSDVIKYVKDHNIKDVYFHGNVSGQKLIKQFVNSDVYILPTSWGEGMATSVLEAMAFGLPVITRPVGGVIDFFENDEMGYLIESTNSSDYANILETLINDPQKVCNISKINHQYASEHFLASKVTERFESDILNHCFSK